MDIQKITYRIAIEKDLDRIVHKSLEGLECQKSIYINIRWFLDGKMIMD